MGKYNGNIDLNKRKMYKGPDGKIRTENSITVGFDDGEYVIPTVIDGKHLSEDDAINYFRQHRRYFGRFPVGTDRNVTGAYANKIHERQDAFYNVKDTKKFDEELGLTGKYLPYDHNDTNKTLGTVKKGNVKKVDTLVEAYKNMEANKANKYGTVGLGGLDKKHGRDISLGDNIANIVERLF